MGGSRLAAAAALTGRPSLVHRHRTKPEARLVTLHTSFPDDLPRSIHPLSKVTLLYLLLRTIGPFPLSCLLFSLIPQAQRRGHPIRLSFVFSPFNQTATQKARQDPEGLSQVSGLSSKSFSHRLYQQQSSLARPSHSPA